MKSINHLIVIYIWTDNAIVYIHHNMYIHRYSGCLHGTEIQILKKSDWAKKEVRLLASVIIVS